MYRKDLSSYRCPGLKPHTNAKSIGWLSSDQPYTQGTVDLALVRKLEAIAIGCPVMQMRGFNYCECCDEEELVVAWDGKRRLLGSAEIWVPASDDVVYAAPDMVSHYVQKHSYLPPREFLEAVARFDPSGTTTAELEERFVSSARTS